MLPVALPGSGSVSVRLRPYHHADAARVVDLFVAAWQQGYRGIVPDAVLSELDVRTATDWLRPSPSDPSLRTTVAESDGVIAGFIRYGADPDPTRDGVGFVAALYVHPDMAGRGIARRLLAHAMTALECTGHELVRLWVFANNVRARQLYAAAGFVPEGSQEVDPRWQTPQVRMTRPLHSYSDAAKVACTVTGPVSTTGLGATLMHEHLHILVPGRYLSGGRRPDELELAERAVGCLPTSGVRTLVNLSGRASLSQPGALGLLRNIGERTGLNIIAGFGYYTERNHPPTVARASMDELTQTFIDSVTVVGEKGVSVGIYGEIATSLDHVTDGEERCLRAAARAHSVTGRAISTHASLGSMAAEQVEILTSEGASPDRIVVGHLDLNPDAAYLETVLRTGVTIGFDTFGKENFDYVLRPEESPDPDSELKRSCHRSDSARLASVAELISRGWERQIVVSTDMSGQEAFLNPNTHGAHGYAYLPEVILPRLRGMGVSPESLETIMVRNPARILTVESLASPTRP